MGQAGNGHRAFLIKLLDYLLKRYENDEAVRRPARFPLQTEVVWNRRTKVVHRHLREKVGPPVLPPPTP